MPAGYTPPPGGNDWGAFANAQPDPNVSNGFVASINASSGSISLVAGSNITLSQANSSITIIGESGASAADFSLNASTGSVSLVAGANITLNSNASTITIVGASGGAFTLNNTTNSVTLVAGGAIGLTNNASTISISAPVATNYSTLSGSIYGNAEAASSTFTIGNSISINFTEGAFGTASGASLTIKAANFSVNGSTASASIVAGGAIGLTNNASTISISAPVATNFSTVSLSALGNTTNNSSGTFNNVLQFSGAGVASVGASLNSVTISVPSVAAASTVSMSASGNTTSSSTGTFNNQLVVSGAGIVSAGVGAGSITISASTPSVVSSLNASTGQLSISAGAGIGIGQANSTITISASVQTSSVSLTALGNTTGSSSGTFSNLLNISGAGIVSVGAGAGSITISASTPSVTNYSTISGNIAGNTALSSTFTIGNTFQLSLAGGISGTASGSSITLSGATGGGGAGTISLSASGNTTGATSSGTFSDVLAVSGMGGVSVGAGNGSISVSGPTQTTLVAGSGISLTSGGSSITIIDTGAGIKLVQNFDLHRAAATVVTKAGTVTGTAGVGSSLFLSRITAPSLMSLTEIDVAMSIGFPATNQGAGTMSRSMVIYSFGNSTSLASVMSASGTSAWNTGTSTAGASSSLTQFQGGWSSPLIQPMTFASTSLAPGEYVVGQLFNFAQGSSTWTLAFYGDPAASSFLASAATNLTSATLGADSVATVAASGVNGISSYGSAFLAGSMLSVISSMSISAAVVMSSLSTGTLAAQISLSSTATQKTATVGVGYVSTNSNIVSSIGTVAGSIINGRTTLGAVTNVALGALNSSTLAQLTLPNFGYIGTGSTTSGFPTAFMAGIMSTGAVPTAITLTSTAVTFSGSAAFQQPWFALVAQ